jgi:hypothetical protein
VGERAVRISNDGPYWRWHVPKPHQAIRTDTSDEYCTYQSLGRRRPKFSLAAYRSCHESEERKRRRLARKWFPCQIQDMKPCLEDDLALVTWLSVKLKSLACWSLRSVYMQNRAISAYQQRDLVSLHVSFPVLQYSTVCEGKMMQSFGNKHQLRTLRIRISVIRLNTQAE